MNLVYKDFLSVEDYNFLRESVGWGKLVVEQAENGIKNSEKIVSCYDSVKIVGCARLLWDKGYVAYLSDVMVLPEYQKNGIGKTMVSKLIDYLKESIKPDWRVKLTLSAAKGKEPFYKKFGFIIRPNDIYGAGMDMWIRK